MLKNKLNNKGLSRKETMTCILLIIIGIAVVSYMTVNKDDSTKFGNFRRLARTFASDAGVLRDNEVLFDEQAYLYDVIKFGYGEELESPFDRGKSCDLYESRIRMENRAVYVTFKCSEYIIYDQISTDDKFTIYKVSDWTDEKLIGENVQTATFYNYEVNGIEVLSDYYIEKEFLVQYSMKAGYTTNFIGNLKSGHTLLEKTYYRTLEEVE